MYKRGAIPSPPDVRDYTIAPRAIAKAYPSSYTQGKPVIGKQRQSNCAAYASSYALEAATGRRMCKGGHYGDREPEHYQGEGRILREVCDTLLKHGTCKHGDYIREYEVSKAQADIQANLDSYRGKAAPYRIKSYARLTSVSDIKTALMRGYGVIFAAACPSFHTNSKGVYTMDTPKYGYHAMAIIGWDGDYAYCPQSWGTGFGRRGFCYVPWADVLALGDVWALEPFDLQKDKSITRRTLRKGMRGADVKALQDALIKRGYDLGKHGADGDFGSATYAALRAYQYAKGLSADGICGPKTWEALDG